jgi:hypothetical protein
LENGEGGYSGSRFKGTDCECNSACFLVYAAGARRNLGYVGIHRTYFDQGRTAAAQLDESADVSGQAARTVENYLSEMGVSCSYIDAMRRTSSREIFVPRYPDVVDSLASWTPEVEEWLIAKCNMVSEREAEQQKRAAYQSERLAEFISMRNAREACASNALAVERAKRRRDLLGVP